MTLRGRVHKFGANIDTDVIIPARYLKMYTPEELAPTAWRAPTPSSRAGCGRATSSWLRPTSAAALRGSTRPWPYAALA